MDISTSNWFGYLREEVLTEGLRDIGLPEFVVDYLEDAMDNTSEKAKMYIANNWKESRGAMAGAYTPNNLKYEMFTYLVDDMFADYIEYNKSETPGTTMATRDPVARIGNIKTREVYDDERVEQNEKVKFIAMNLRNTMGKPQGTWRKSFMKAVKALSKAGLPSEKVESLKEYLRSFYSKNFHYWMNQRSELVDFLNDDPTNYELVKGESIDRAQSIAIEYLENKEDPEYIMHEFDDGSYWYNLNVSSCDVEASRMGHCGSDSRGVLVSLRKKKGKRRESSSYVTMTWSDYENTLYQIKGRSNDAPPEETWDHIAWFINNYNIENVEETGEHSNDYDGFAEMNNYLAGQTSANFHGSIEDRLEKAEEYCNGVDRRFYDNRDELERSEISYSVEEEMNEVYVYASAQFEFEINLGWPGIKDKIDGYAPTGNQDFERIPTTYSGAREFADDIGLDEMNYEMPGENGEVDYEVKMLIGPGEPEPEPTAHLVITLTTSETFSADEDGEVLDYDQFADNMLAFEEDEVPAAIERVRQALAAGGYMAKTAYDRSKEELMKITNLDKWHVKEDGGGLEFDWTADDGQPLHDYTGEPVLDSNRAQMYGTGTGNVMGVNPLATFKEIFGYGRSYQFANMQGIVDTGIAVAFARELSSAISAHLKSKSKAPGQQTLDFGEKYKEIDPIVTLADDTDFVVFPKIRYHGGRMDNTSRERYPDIKIVWLYRMRVGPDSLPEEAEVIQEIAAFLNENEELVTAAANKVIGMYVEDFNRHLERRKNKVMDNQEIQNLINKIKSDYVAGADAGDQVAERIWLIANWFENNYADMNEAQRYIMAVKYLIPMMQRNFRAHSDMGQVDTNTGTPVMFDELVASQIERMGGQPVKMVTRNENKSKTIQTIKEDDPNYDLRIYKVDISVSIQKNLGGEAQETQTEIRGIEGVTTVRTIGDTLDVGTSQLATYEVKFELLGNIGRVKYRDRVLIPGLMKIKGLKILKLSPVHRTNVRGTIRTVRESQDVWSMYQTNQSFNTPRISLKDTVADWAEGGVMDYDTPMDANNMRYHVMMPVTELMPLLASPRAPEDMMDGKYQDFIKNGATMPVYIAIGMNGVAKITGNQDIVHHAIRAGLEELPVFLSYQRQV